MNNPLAPRRMVAAETALNLRLRAVELLGEKLHYESYDPRGARLMGYCSHRLYLRSQWGLGIGPWIYNYGGMR
jgi:hypothetical protein